MADLQQQCLLPLHGQRGAAGEPLEPLRIDTTLAGLAFRTIKIIQVLRSAGPHEDEPAEPPGP
ncbi:hypothetical protein ACFQE7_11065 [Nonomuraea ferruginea]|uniref:hypothetical protein n=1 Tax=Nonomuraea ferruginea TaxID=46174 RepID=UPI003611EA93